MAHKINGNAREFGLENDLKPRAVRDMENLAKVTPVNSLFRMRSRTLVSAIAEYRLTTWFWVFALPLQSQSSP